MWITFHKLAQSPLFLTITETKRRIGRRAPSQTRSNGPPLFSTARITCGQNVDEGRVHHSSARLLRTDSFGTRSPGSLLWPGNIRYFLTLRCARERPFAASSFPSRSGIELREMDGGGTSLRCPAPDTEASRCCSSASEMLVCRFFLARGAPSRSNRERSEDVRMGGGTPGESLRPG